MGKTMTIGNSSNEIDLSIANGNISASKDVSATGRLKGKINTTSFGTSEPSTTGAQNGDLYFKIVG